MKKFKISFDLKAYASIEVDADDEEARFTPQDKNTKHKHIHFSPPDEKALKYAIKVLKSVLKA